MYVWAVEGDCDSEALRSNTFTMEWPPHSGRRQTYPEADRAAWFSLPRAKEKILKSQRPFLDELERLLHERSAPRAETTPAAPAKPDHGG